jgi:hypothetical protein
MHKTTNPSPSLATRLASIILAVTTLSMGTTVGQSLEEAKQFPPASMRKEVSEEHLRALAWQIRLEENLSREYRKSRDMIRQEIGAVTSQIEKLTQQLPVEFRFLDSAARTSLASNLSERILDLKLEIATLERLASIADADQSRDADLEHQLLQQEAQIDIRAAELEAERSQQQLEQTERLKAKNFVPEGEVRDARFQLNISKLQLEKALLAMKSLEERTDSDRARRNAEILQERQPLEAQLSVAQEQLTALAKSSLANNKIESLKRQAHLMMQDLEGVARKLIQHSQAKLELEVLRDAIKAELEK